MYQADDGLTKIEVTFDGDTVWLTQDQMSELFQRDTSVISRHIKNVFSEGELDEKSNLQKMQFPNSDKEYDKVRDFAIFTYSLFFSLVQNPYKLVYSS
jgi:hypothetical protein